MKKHLTFRISLICLLMLSGVSVLAQSSRQPSSVERRVETLNRQGSEYEREDQRREMEGKKNNPADKKLAQQITAEVKEDFEHIQTIYNRIVIAMSSKEPPDYKFIADATSEVKKRASRLKTNLALPKIEDEDKSQKKEETELTEAQINPSLLSLRNHIYNFVTNPLFESSRVLDVAQATKASRDLEQIIKFSESILKYANKMK